MGLRKTEAGVKVEYLDKNERKMSVNDHDVFVRKLKVAMEGKGGKDGMAHQRRKLARERKTEIEV